MQFKELGDIGVILPNSNLKIIDRISNMFKNAFVNRFSLLLSGRLCGSE
jgi:hypothetical protein